MKFIITIFTLLMMTNSCDSSKKAIENNSKMQETLSGTYFINQLGDTDVAYNKLVITFDETSNKITGFAGCNSFFGSYSVDKNKILFNNIASSKKYCQETMAIENQFLKSLDKVDSFSISDIMISLSGKGTILINGTNTIATAGKSASTNYDDKVKYQALSRNSFDFIIISKSEILVSKDQNLKHIDTYKIKTEDWEALNLLIETVDVETIKDLKPPSTKHQFDGAPHATLAIIIGDIEYRTPTFDHGNPPEIIEALVNKVLSIKESTVKQ